MVMATTTLSSKGQVVIPLAARKALGLREGDALAVQAENDVVVIRKIKSMTADEKRTLARLDKIWKDIEKGKISRAMTVEEFRKELNTWLK
jgi:AbrB family looped-hinge helix DNA binding protein